MDICIRYCITYEDYCKMRLKCVEINEHWQKVRAKKMTPITTQTHEQSVPPPDEDSIIAESNPMQNIGQRLTRQPKQTCV